MPLLFSSLSSSSCQSLVELLSQLPSLPPSCQWFNFLRCHDELTLEMVPKEERKQFFVDYCKDERFDFREGQGISSRLFDLFQGNIQKIILANSLLLSLKGTPIIYYGDEVGKQNDLSFFEEMYNISGYKDTRYYCRGRMDWKSIETSFSGEESERNTPLFLFNQLAKLISIRKKYKSFSRGDTLFYQVFHDSHLTLPNHSVLSFQLKYKEEEVEDTKFIFHNLSPLVSSFYLPPPLHFLSSSSSPFTDLLGKGSLPFNSSNQVTLPPLSSFWLSQSN